MSDLLTSTSLQLKGQALTTMSFMKHRDQTQSIVSTKQVLEMMTYIPSSWIYELLEILFAFSGQETMHGWRLTSKDYKSADNLADS